MSKTHNLNPSEKDAICRKVRENPVEQVIYFGSPEDERRDNKGISSFGVIEGSNAFDVWVEDDDVPLLYGGSFNSYEAALAHARVLAAETRNQAESYLNQLKDEEWAARPVAMKAICGPFRFRDNTDYRGGWDLETAEDLFAFWQMQFNSTDEPAGNAYEWRLVDGNGIDCQVTRNHRGEMRIEPFEDEG